MLIILTVRPGVGHRLQLLRFLGSHLIPPQPEVKIILKISSSAPARPVFVYRGEAVYYNGKWESEDEYSKESTQTANQLARR